MRRALVACAAALAAAGCGGGLDESTVRIETGDGSVSVPVEVADSADERRRGLMGRESLPDGTGMLFVYEEDASSGFWMKDTLIPLSVAFVAGDGRILHIADMEPCRADPCPVYEPGRAYRLALEVDRGAFERLGVAVGDRLTVER